MRRNLFLMIALSALLSAWGCKKNDKDKGEGEQDPAAETETTETETPEDDAPPEPVPPEEAGSDMVNKMANCPSVVAGAETNVEEADGKVVVSITAGDDKAVAEIRKRASYLAGLEAESDEVKHTGEGTGGGELGKCPVVMADVELASEEVDGGVKVTLTPAGDASAADLAKMAKERAQALEAGARVHGSGTGGGMGGHGGDGSAGGTAPGSARKAKRKGGAPADKMDDMGEEDMGQ